MTLSNAGVGFNAEMIGYIKFGNVLPSKTIERSTKS
jgi:hypothetical protein